MRRRSARISSTISFMAVMLVSSGFVLAQNKIGVVNSQEVLEKSAEGKKVMAQIQERDKKNQDSIAKLDEEIRNLETRINTQRLTLTQEALMNMSSDLEKKRTERKRFAEDSLREMQEFTARLFQKVQNELLPIIEQVGKDKGMDLIFDLARSGAIYFNPTTNLTQEVITRYDASKAAK